MDLSIIFKIPWEYLTQSYWRDEAFRIFLAKYNFLDIIRLTYNDGQPPLYYFILHYWMKIFGDSEMVTRALSLVFFELLIFVVWKFAKAIKPKDRFFPWLVMLLTFFNPSLFYYAFEARMYMLFVFLVTTSCYFLFKKEYTKWLFTALLGLYTHNFMIFVVCFQAVWVFFQTKQIQKTIKFLSLIAVGYLPWIGVLAHQATLVKNDFWISPLTIGSILSAPAGLFFGYENNPIALYGFFVMLSVLLLLAFAFSSREKNSKFFFFWIIIPTLLAIISSIFFRPIFLARYLCFIPVPMSILLGLLISRMKKNWRVIGSVVVIFLLIYVSGILFPFRVKVDIRSGVQEIADIAKPTDAIYTSSLNFFETKYYFAKFAPPVYTNKVPIKVYSANRQVPFFVGRALISNEDITNQVFGYQRIFIVDEKGRVRIFVGHR